mgnify:CR=1 FL=1
MRSLILALTLFAVSLTHNAEAQKCKHYGQSFKAEISRSDSVDILHYHIALDVSNFSGETIEGSCTISLKSKLNGLDKVQFDLEGLAASSVQIGTEDQAFQQVGNQLIITLSNALSENEEIDLTIVYSGSPIMDGSGWGGWYWTGNYAFNLGVAFESYPHNYGRIWYPCFDNFVERATYSFAITTKNEHMAYCNGTLTGSQSSGADKTIWHWELTTPIPTYLSSIAVAEYIHTEIFFESVSGNTIPMYLISEPGAQANLVASFVHLPDAMESFEGRFGPYNWNKVGFHLVPFNSGAMEHATDIAYPASSADGTTNSETLMAHELSHHWWGNYVTCRTQDDMWINEGMARYSEHLFLETVYGYDRYIRDVKQNHMDVLKSAHLKDGDFYALHGVPTEVTYGDHTYNKGAEVAHNLRGFMGEDAFFAACQALLEEYALKDIDAHDFRDFMEDHAQIDLNPFFDAWIFKPGFPSYDIELVTPITSTGVQKLELITRQKTRAVEDLHSQNQLSATFVKEDWTLVHVPFVHVGATQTTVLEIPTGSIEDVLFLNGNDTLLQATSGETVIATSTAPKLMDDAFIRVDPVSISDSLFIRVDHHWVSPDLGGGLPDGIALVGDHYWTSVILSNGPYESEARVDYNAASSGSAIMDPSLLDFEDFNEDLMRVLYREKTADAWTVDYNIEPRTFSSKTDGSGFIDIMDFKSGQYTFGYVIDPSAVEELSSLELDIKLYPNPTSDVLNVDFKGIATGNYIIMDSQGRNVLSGTLETARKIDVSNLPEGAYMFQISSKHGTISKELLIQKD